MREILFRGKKRKRIKRYIGGNNMKIMNTWINEEQTCTNCGTEVLLDVPDDLYHSFRYGNMTWYCPVCQKANRASERPKPVSFAEAMTKLGLALATTDEGGGARNSEKNR